MLLPLLFAAAPVPPVGTDVRHRTYLQNFKDGVLAGCIAEAYGTSADATKDASASAGGYLQEFSTFDFEHGADAMRALIKRTLAQTYGSFQGPSVRLDLMKCIDLYHGAELDRLGRHYSTNSNGSYAADEAAEARKSRR